jgi:plasmid stabilization system protein ParE
MELKWTRKAVDDIERLYEFLAVVNKPAASRVIQALTAAPVKLMEQPRLGEKLEEFEPREVRHIFVSKYEMRYEIQDSTIYVLRLWLTKEDR